MMDSGDLPVFRVAEKEGPAGRLVLRHEARGATDFIVIAGFQGSALPAQLTNPVIEGESGTAGAWRLTCQEGQFHFGARAVDRVAERPALFEPMHRPFALSGADRLAIRVLLWLLRLPGGARLLRHWHSRRG